MYLLDLHFTWCQIMFEIKYWIHPVENCYPWFQIARYGCVWRWSMSNVLYITTPIMARLCEHKNHQLNCLHEEYLNLHLDIIGAPSARSPHIITLSPTFLTEKRPKMKRMLEIYPTAISHQAMWFDCYRRRNQIQAHTHWIEANAEAPPRLRLPLRIVTSNHRP